ncbi:hypothetical protein DPSP01_014770 [Paraphaeosphaeria sporulosa]
MTTNEAGIEAQSGSTGLFGVKMKGKLINSTRRLSYVTHCFTASRNSRAVTARIQSLVVAPGTKCKLRTKMSAESVSRRNDRRRGPQSLIVGLVDTDIILVPLSNTFIAPALL